MSTPTNEREAAIRARLAAATPGPWAWFGDMKIHNVYLATQKMGRRFVMQFGRWGMKGGQPIFQHDAIMRTMPELCDLGLIVAKDYGSREIIDFAHPDAQLIANAPADLSWLLSRIEELAKAPNQLSTAIRELVGCTAKRHSDGCASGLDDGGCTCGVTRLRAVLSLVDAADNATETTKSGVEMIAAERQRQISTEGWTPEHDDEHQHGEMAITAACYAVTGTDAEVLVQGQDAWAWGSCYDKRRKHDRMRCLVIAGALIAAEIDRQTRLALASDAAPSQSAVENSAASSSGANTP